MSFKAKKRKSLIKRVSLILVICLFLNVIAAYAVSAPDTLPENKYGVDYRILDAVATPSSVEGKYNATLTARMVVNGSTIKSCWGTVYVWSWKNDRLPAPTIGGVTIPVWDGPESVSEPFELEEDTGLNFTSAKSGFWYFEEPWMEPGENGTAYKQFYLNFEGFDAVPGETLKEVVRLKDDRYPSTGGTKTTFVPMELDPDTGDEVDGVTEDIDLGSIRIPGRTITYKADDSESAAGYIQTCKTDEETETVTVLDNDATQDSGNLEKPNFTVPDGKKFGGWSTSPGAETVTYKVGDALSTITENVTLYPVWVNKSVYTVTYDGNGGTVDKESDSITEGESLSEFPTAAWNGYEFLGWFTEGGEEVTLPYTPDTDVTLYAHWDAISATCPFTLNIADFTLKDINGNVIAATEGNGNNGPFSYNEAAGLITIDSRIFDGVCRAAGEHSHKLLVEGSNSKVLLNLTNSSEAEAFTPFDISVNGVTARGIKVNNVKQLTFSGDCKFGGKVSDMGSTLAGVSLGDTIQQIVISNGAAVTGYNDGGDNANASPIQLNENTAVKQLDLLMNETVSEETIIKIAGTDKTLPANMNRIAVLDRADGIWLTGDIEVKNADGTQKYVRGVAENASDTTYIDRQYSGDNIYGDTFALSGVEGNAAIGRYQAVHLPVKLKQLSITVPTRVVFNVYTSGADNENGDYGFIAPEYELKNNSIIYADSFVYSKGGSNVTRNFGRTDASVEVGYAGVKEDVSHSSMYTLKSYEEVTEGEMSQTVGKPFVCLEVEANHDNNKRISISESNDFSAAPTNWFTASHGTSNIQLKVPKAYSDGNPKRYYQIPKDIQEDDKDNTVLRGFHTMKLGFTLN